MYVYILLHAPTADDAAEATAADAAPSDDAAGALLTPLLRRYIYTYIYQ